MDVLMRSLQFLAADALDLVGSLYVTRENSKLEVEIHNSAGFRLHVFELELTIVKWPWQQLTGYEPKAIHRSNVNMSHVGHIESWRRRKNARRLNCLPRACD